MYFRRINCDCLALYSVVDSHLPDIFPCRWSLEFMQPININSPRAKKSRIAKVLRKKAYKLSLKTLFWISFISGLGFFIVGESYGYLLLTLSSVSASLLLWNKGELTRLEDNLGHSSIDGLLDPKILANLRNDTPSALDVFEAAKSTEARWFLQNRFILHPSIFEQFLSREPNSANAVWEQAEILRNKNHLPSYHSSIILVALLKTIPNFQQLLSQANLQIEDLESSIGWLNGILAKRKLAKKNQHFGGIGRDLAFGYTPILGRLGYNLSHDVENYGFFQQTPAHDQVVDRIIDVLGGGNSSIALIGEVGAGKTTCVYSFAERLLSSKATPPNIRNHQVVSLDAPSLISQAHNPGELESLMIQILNEAIKAKNIILFFDDAYVFFSEGTGSVDLTKIIQPAIESSGVKIIFAMTPKELQQLSSRSSLTSRMQRLQIPPLNEEETLSVLRDQVIFIEGRQKVLFTNQALRESYRMGSRYIDDQVMPGAALSVLKAAAPMAKNGYITDDVVQQSIEASTGAKVAKASSDESAKLLSLEDQLHKYVINQKQAVSVIADALRRSRSGVGNPERPVGTFLFLGPTGVGKTELSKALARTYFESEESIIRVDMNQFVRPEDVDRLITPTLGEQLGFLGQVRRSPSSVILLDEIEKAHPNVVNLLLQMLDEGAMKDIDNKPVSFKDSIVIATSNAGADKIREMIQEGQDILAAQEKLVDYIIEQKIFAPEFVNRFDEVVMFRPLTPEELIKVIDLILAGINKTLDAQSVQVELSEAAKKWLVDKGYDQRLGARPMRRVAQKYVENIMAKKLLTHEAGSGSKIYLDVADFENLDNN
jgi:ATP-dependent Clp protease ATP-binding subunit ClpC